MTQIDKFCLSSYLAFRYVPVPDCCWINGITPRFPQMDVKEQWEVGSAEEVLQALQIIIGELASPSEVGIFLSSGIDSATLAALLPKGTRAYTIDFTDSDFSRESQGARAYAEEKGLKHTIVEVTWEDYLQYESELMIHKKAPLHPVEVGLYLAALKAKEDGLDTVILGNGADSTFGGLDKLLSRDWTFDEFVTRYTFVAPERVLSEPEDVRFIYEKYRKGADYIDVMGFLKIVHGLGIIQAFDNAIELAGMKSVQPYERLKLKGELDIRRIRMGEPKYLLKEVFSQLYPGWHPPQKVPFARPTDVWLKDYEGPRSSYFREEIPMNEFTGEQKYIIRCLDRFIDLIESGAL